MAVSELDLRTWNTPSHGPTCTITCTYTLQWNVKI